MTANTNFHPLVALFFAFSTVNAHAQTQSVPTTTTKSDWSVSAGAAIATGPRYAGSSKNKTMAIPTFDLRYRDWFFINPIAGVGVSADLLDGLKGTASIGVSFDKREAKDDVRLRGLGDIGFTPAINLGLEYRLGNAFVKSKLISRLGSSNKQGTLLETEVGYNVLASRAGVLGLGLQVKAMDNTYAGNFFGVSASQSNASGMAVFKANSGVASAGAFVQAIVPLTDRWTFFGRAANNKLRNAAAISPITVDRDQSSLLATMIYKF
ncbi:MULTISPECIES: MipA/OmpV family protein [unclassified Janthinobacterium]|uniref:MipA/OmpV family protein n=1 Tax=unclassified Janthinobacterium TaxID=2610881 RepID=UPI0018CB3BEA|nr:MipA/OmpV family protein [Janthinobacterium sp. CG_23.4]MDH6159694.1 outer membrane scaffolding protein for murein synthesis (MipA/OmpV family) [Janthinobacterium sp. CG_23.4]